MPALALGADENIGGELVAADGLFDRSGHTSHYGAAWDLLGNHRPWINHCTGTKAYSMRDDRLDATPDLIFYGDALRVHHQPLWDSPPADARSAGDPARQDKDSLFPDIPAHTAGRARAVGGTLQQWWMDLLRAVYCLPHPQFSFRIPDVAVPEGSHLQLPLLVTHRAPQGFPLVHTAVGDQRLSQ